MVSAPDCSKDVVQLDGNGAERKESSNNHVGETGSTPKQRHSSTIFSPQWQKNPCFEIKKERSEQVHIFTDRISKRACGSNIARPAISPPLAHAHTRDTPLYHNDTRNSNASGDLLEAGDWRYFANNWFGSARRIKGCCSGQSEQVSDQLVRLYFHTQPNVRTGMTSCISCCDYALCKYEKLVVDGEHQNTLPKYLHAAFFPRMPPSTVSGKPTQSQIRMHRIMVPKGIACVDFVYLGPQQGQSSVIKHVASLPHR